jgi:hypothetical protein
MVSGMSELATFTYLGPSGLTDDGGLRLQTCGGAAPHPRFFTGFVTAAEPVAVGLLAVAEVARTRYHQPIDTRSLDPVVTGSPGHLRFESFSGCCGVYARIDALACASGLPAARVRAALTQLGTAGRVGFDVAEAACFHRVLPYDASAAAKLNPRLLGARRLVDEGAVELGADTAWVRSGDERYEVRVSGGAPVSCTCPWWARYRGGRGPCKHALAVGMAAEGVSA